MNKFICNVKAKQNGLPGNLKGVSFRGVSLDGVLWTVLLGDLLGDKTTDCTSFSELLLGVGGG